MNGIIILNKPAGFTSLDAVTKLRGILRERRIGHAGTLDPQATGVLVVLVGNAARCSGILPKDDKVYETECVFGVETDTEDIWGKVLKEEGVKASLEEIKSAIESFTGTYLQTPPMYSAKKVQGRKLYELARQGIEIERKACAVTIHEITDVHVSEEEGVRASFTVHVSSGTYIRSLIRDIAASIGERAAMTALKRTLQGIFPLSAAHSFSEIEEAVNAGNLSDILIPTERVFETFPCATVLPEYEPRFLNGNKLLPEMVAFGTSGLMEDGARFRIRLTDGSFKAVYEVKEGVLTPYKMFL
jgi:tRNA pseudouridine55 synthase